MRLFNKRPRETDGLRYVHSKFFQAKREETTRLWDKEWMRYFSSGKDYSFYFYNFDTDHYALNYTPKVIKDFSEEDFYKKEFYKKVKGGVWLPGCEFVEKKVVEIGCGPGIMGRIASRFVKSYTGVDVSLFALYIARLTSPQSCSYIHMFDTTTLSSLKNSFDTAYGRNFFIHHNYQDSLWLLALMRDLTKEGGTIHADFFGNEQSIDGQRRVGAQKALSKGHPSSLYYFSDESIIKIADEVGLNLEDITYVHDAEVKFCRLRK